MRNIIQVFFISVLLTACASQYISDGEQKYLQSKNGKKLVIPSPLTGENISGFYILPAQTQNPKVGIEPPYHG